MGRKEKFFNDDKVVRVGTKAPVMTIKGKTMKGGLPYTSLTDTWTCYWEENGPHWEEMDEAELERLSD